jgi:hypothetical protein
MKRFYGGLLNFMLMLAVVAGCWGCAAGTGQKVQQAQVVVVGGGTGGTAAAIQSARSGATTILVCESAWLGGMLTAAGVSCTDGNHLLPSGLWQEFREAVYQHYGTRNLATGWVSNFNFEPRVGASVLAKMAEKEPNLTILYQHQFDNLKVRTAADGSMQITSVFVKDLTNGALKELEATVYIDGTELGDLMAAAGCSYDVGLEPEDVSGEKGYGVTAAFGVIQDLTYAAVLKDYGKGADKTIARPAGYTDAEFACSNNEDCNDPKKLYSNVTAQKMLDYGRLPNNKFMINWPSNGNDFFTDIIHRTAEERAKALDSARQKTLRFVYYIQTRLGLKHIGLADDEFDTPDRLPYIPYHREGRRLQGLVRFTSADIIRPGEKSALYRTGISVGDYPIDHHHRMYPGPQPNLTFVPVPSYSVPAGSMVSAQVTNLVVCDKSISVSNIMNGTTRLQPVVLLTGQAAGVLAAQAAMARKPVKSMSVRSLQRALLGADAYLMPYADVLPADSAWQAIQQVGASGLMMGTGKAEGWANKTWFYPDSTLAVDTLVKWAANYGVRARTPLALPGSPAVTRWHLEQLFVPDLDAVIKQQQQESTTPTPMTRRQIALWLLQNTNCFSREVDWDGSFID